VKRLRVCCPSLGRADLLNGIESRNWRKVWASACSPIFFSLGGRYLDHFKDRSLVLALRQRCAPSSQRMMVRACEYLALSNTTHLVAGIPTFHGRPYEEYERQFLPAEIAERSAEFKLFLAFLADNIGLQPSALVNVAETLAQKALGLCKCPTSVIGGRCSLAYASVTPDDLRQALEQ